jgi:hypothetical protein
MRGAANTGTIAPATDQLVARATDRSALRGLMSRLRLKLRHKPSYELSEILHCPLRTAERLFAGERTPDAVNLWRLMGAKHIATVLEERTRSLSPADYDEFWREVSMAALRAVHREKLDER